MKRSFALTLSLMVSLGLAAPVFAGEVLPSSRITIKAPAASTQTGVSETETGLPGTEAMVFQPQTGVSETEAGLPETENMLPENENTLPPVEEQATAQVCLANGKEITDENIREIIYGLKAEYPEGRSWTNDDTYYSSAAHFIGGGCEAFALICTDAAFGNLPISSTHSDFDAIRVGDVVRINHDTHAVVVLEKHRDSIVIAEGNYNHSIHWGRRLTRSNVESGEFYVRTRYPKTDKLTLSRAACTLKPGELTALFLSISGDQAADSTPVWTSSDRGIVEVDTVGWIRAVREGTAVITAKVDGLSVSCVVTVDANAPGVVQ